MYTGPFSEADLLPIFDAAEPMPPDPIEDEDIHLGCRRLMPRREALVRRLELLDGIVGIALEQQQKKPPSVHAKALHAVAAAARELLDKLGAIDGNVDNIPRQLWNSLRGAAELSGDRWLGNAAIDLRHSIAGVGKLAAWAESAKEIEAPTPPPLPEGIKPKRRAPKRVPQGVVLPEDDLWLGDAHNDALLEICKIWRDVLGRKIATSVYVGQKVAGGPLIRFAAACLKLVDLDALSSDAIRSRIRNIQNDA